MDREEVRFRSGGDECAAWLYRPGRGDAAAPCVVLGSGLSCVRDQRLDAFAERFAAAGFAAFAFDYRYFGDSGGEPRGLVLSKLQRDDWRAALALARSLDGIDADRLAIWGFSLGGGHVQSLAASEPGIAAAICVAPVVDTLRTLVHIGGPLHPLRLVAAGLRDAWKQRRGAPPYRVPAAGPPGSIAVLNSPHSAPGFEAVTPPGSSWRNELCARAVLAPPYRLGGRAREIRCPVLYCIAEDDDINPPKLGVRAAQRAPRGELRRYPGGHFDPLLGGTFERVAADQVDFLKRTLAGTSDARGMPA